MSLVFSERLRAALALPRYIAPPLAGIELSTSRVRAARLIESPHGLILVGHAEEGLPPGAVSDGEIIERKPVVEALMRVAKKAGVTTAHASLPETKAYLFETTATGSTPDEWRTSVEQHLDELIPLPPIETIFDIIPIGQEQDTERVVGIGFARRFVDDTLSVFDEAGIRIQSFEGEMFSSVRALLTPSDTTTTLIIDVGNTTTKIYIVAQRTPYFATTINIGGLALTRAVQKYFSVTEVEAEKIKETRGISSTSENQEYLAAMLSTVSAIRDEIARRLEYWQERAEVDGVHKPVTRALIVGSNAGVHGLPEYLQEVLRVPVTVGNVFTNLALGSTWIPSIHRTESLLYATAIGLALRDGELV